MTSPLRHHHNTTDFLHLGIIRGAYTIEISSNLSAKICYAYELLQDVLWHDVCVSCLLRTARNNVKGKTREGFYSTGIGEPDELDSNLYVIRVHVDVIDSEVEVGS